MKHKIKFKVIKGVNVIICSKCSQIIKYEKYFSEEEKLALNGKIELPAQYCDKCEEKMTNG